MQSSLRIDAHRLSELHRAKPLQLRQGALDSKAVLMDGKDSSGRMVSLLNADHISDLPHPRLSGHSRASSYSTQASFDSSYSSQTILRSPPIFSPRTPRLTRKDSSSSQGIVETPSPITPTSPYEQLAQPKAVNQYDNGYTSSMYPVPQAAGHAELPYYQLPTENERSMEEGYDQVRPGSRHGDMASPATSDASGVSQAASKFTPKKNQYPCPHAARFNCADTFTTSGHAARHGKKHTGEKNILCPDCNKAFTRKDNMKQHQRTHQSKRDLARALKGSDEQRRKKVKPEHQVKKTRQTLDPDMVQRGTAIVADVDVLR